MDCGLDQLNIQNFNKKINGFINKLMIWYTFWSIAYFKSNTEYGTTVFVITLRMKKKM